MSSYEMHLSAKLYKNTNHLMQTVHAQTDRQTHLLFKSLILHGMK